MLIDWFTVAAQIVNFLILVLLLKRFLYKPILKAVDEREERIAAQITEAAERNAEAEKQRSLFQQKNSDFDRERQTRTLEAMAEVKAERQSLLDAANKEYNALREQRLESLLAEERGLQQEIIQKTQTEVFALTRKILTDMASDDLEQRMTEAFIRQIRNLPASENQKLVASFRASDMPVILRSVFPLAEVQQQALRSVVAEILGNGSPVTFETAPELIGGLELVTNGYKVAWNMAEALETTGKNADRILQEKYRPVVREGGVSHGTSQT